MTSTSTTSTNNTGLGSKIKGAAQAVHGMGENVRGTILGGVETVFHRDSSGSDAIAAQGRDEGRVGAEKAFGVMGDTAGNVNSEYSNTYASQPTHLGTMADTVRKPTQPNAPQNPGTMPLHADPRAAAPLSSQPGYIEQPPSSAPVANTDLYDSHHDPAATAQRIPSYDGPGNIAQDFSAQRTHRPGDEPSHHRADARDLDAARSRQGTGPPVEYVSKTGELPADTSMYAQPERRGAPAEESM
ncbi:hypothetical protein C8F01DRAFT_1252589 [Mycena amicta]|nr:hypothetical protein C8F01DRAFT_1252589 [Mycena amicta]